MKQRGMKVSVLAVAAIALTGCFPAGTEADRSSATLRQESITLNDGRVVQCVIYASGYGGGVSCDWETAG